MRIATVTTTHTNPDMVRWFVHCQLNCGAHRVFIFLDDPTPDQMVSFDDPRVVVTPRTRDQYIKAGISEESAFDWNIRAANNVMEAMQQARDAGCEWLAIFDVDELIQTPDMRLEQLLDNIPPDTQQILVRTREAVPRHLECTNPFTDITRFRFQLPWWSLGRVGIERRAIKMLGCQAALFDNEYYRGHRHGKCIIRTDAPLKVEQIDSHRALPDAHERTYVRPDCWVLHYDAPSYKFWAHKWQRRTRGKTGIGRPRTNRKAQIDRFIEADRDDTQREALFRELYMMPSSVFLRLRLFGLAGTVKHPARLFEPPPPPSPA